MGWLDDTLDFEKHRWSGILDNYKEDPWRLLIGAGPDKASTKIWNAILDKDWEPMTDYWGNATDKQFEEARAAGIDTGASEDGYQVADTIAKLFTAKWGAGKLGGALSGNGASTAQTASQPNAVQSMGVKAGAGTGGAGTGAGGMSGVASNSGGAGGAAGGAGGAGGAGKALGGMDVNKMTALMQALGSYQPAESDIAKAKASASQPRGVSPSASVVADAYASLGQPPQPRQPVVSLGQLLMGG